MRTITSYEITENVSVFSIQIVDVQKWWFNCKHHCGHEQGFPRNGVSGDFFVFFLYEQCLSVSVKF